MAIQVKTKKWGNSMAIIIPSEAVAELNIRPNEEVSVEIEKKANVLKELFGSLRFDAPTEKILRETRAELESKWL